MNNKLIGLLVIAVTVIILASFVFAQTTPLSCTLRSGSCLSGEVNFLQANSEGMAGIDNSMPLKFCCSGPSDLTNSCGVNGTVILKLTGQNNAEVGLPETALSNQACLATAEGITCTYPEGPCESDQACVASLFESSGQVGECNYWSQFPGGKNVCCGGGFEAQENTSMVTGGCWNKQYIPLGDFARYANGTILKDVLNYKGAFFGCDIPSNDPRLQIKDTHFPEQPVVNNMPVCTSFENAKPGAQRPHFFCDSSGIWIDDSEPRDQDKTVGWDISESPELIATNCCSASSCWNGETCQVNQYGDSRPDPVYPNDMRCINGTWIAQPRKMTWDGSATGFCSSPSECLADPFGNQSHDGDVNRLYKYQDAGNRPQCLNSGQYFLDYNCAGGEWSSRTKVLGEQLLSFALTDSPEDFTLYCDSFEKVLTWFDYTIGPTSLVDYLNTSCTIEGVPGYPCVNNFCVLTYGNQIAFGTSINTPIDGESSFLTAVGAPVDSCNGVRNNNGNFDSCGESVWYNHDTEEVIYLPSGTLQPVTETARNYIKEPYQDIVEFAFSETTPPPTYQDFFNTTRIFDKIYIAQEESRTLFSFLETHQKRPAGKPVPYKDWVALKYDGPYIGDICAEFPAGIIRLYDEKADCKYIEATNTYYVVRAQNSEPQERPVSPLIQGFPDLAGKLRPS